VAATVVVKGVAARKATAIAAGVVAPLAEAGAEVKAVLVVAVVAAASADPPR
jgi:hypothetical protein